MGRIMRVMVTVHILTHAAVVARECMLDVRQPEAMELAMAAAVRAPVAVHMVGRGRQICTCEMNGTWPEPTTDHVTTA